MRYLLFLFSVLLLSSCGVYQIQTTKRPEITHVLAITSVGDTIQVPINDIRRQIDVNHDTYSNWRFYWDNSWYYGSGWYSMYDPYWYNRYNIYRYNPYRVNPKIRLPKKVEVPQRYRPVPNRQNRVESATPRGSRTPQVQPNRGRSNQQTRTPQNIQSRVNVGRGNSTTIRRNNNN